MARPLVSDELWELIEPLIPKLRWVVERTIAWLHQHRRLRVRYERRVEIHEAFLAIGCSLICLKLLQGDATPS
jgi:transposase